MGLNDISVRFLKQIQSIHIDIEAIRNQIEHYECSIVGRSSFFYRSITYLLVLSGNIDIVLFPK